ncbi:MAG TPA: protein-disulfide reductase DsbD family protein [Rhizobiaceae bacterium]|nr:protein-disulfide reductase DsbD family protein [Rhizobiaceae bacterium]
MKHTAALLPCAIAALCFLAPAGHAVQSATVSVDGGAVTLIVAEPQASEITMRGALKVDLKPGWKTYWRDPGDAGVPPQIDISQSENVSGVTLRFPPPVRLADAYTVFAGYDRSVLLPVEFDRQTPGASTVRASVFLGICEHICIPVSAMMEVAVTPATGSSLDGALVDEAFAALPGAAREGFRIIEAHLESDRLNIFAEVPDEGPWSVFLDGGGRWSFEIPEPVAGSGGQVRFSLAVHRKPKTGTPASGFAATLTDGARSIDQTITPE